MTQVVWFKKDLRVQDHGPLLEASRTLEPVMPLYIIEPPLWEQADSSFRHWRFIHDSLVDLDQALKSLGQGLVIMTGNPLEVFEKIRQTDPAFTLRSHEETGNTFTFQRDMAVKHWCKTYDIEWVEYANGGVIRRLDSKDNWQAQHKARMNAPLFETPSMLTAQNQLQSELLPPIKRQQNELQTHGAVQRGGMLAGQATLTSFLKSRSRFYRGNLSKPEPAQHACSRLSPHLTYGTLSMKEVMHRCQHEIKLLKDKIKETQTPEILSVLKQKKAGITAMISRLYWHCHFIQKLESQPSIEYQCMHPGFEDMRERNQSPEKLQKWYLGQTGYPLVDACMKCLHQTGWLNFRMRAMVVSFASYQLWLDWRDISPLLAGLFTDYEPGIHFSQLQMQSGVTGINAIRIYNPIKQSYEKDKYGRFIRKFIPALATIPNEWIHEPWKMPPSLQTQFKCIIGKDYPAPCVDLTTSTRQAREKLAAYRKQVGFKEEAKKVYERHGSRKRRATGKRTSKAEPAADQLRLAL